MRASVKAISTWVSVLLISCACVHAYEAQLVWKVEQGASPVSISSDSKVDIRADSTGLMLSASVIDKTPNSANAIHDADRMSDDDRVVLYVRPTPSADRYYQFSVSSAGATADSQGSSNGNSNVNWTEHWDGAAVAIPGGYSVKIKIPWETLGVSFSDGFSGQIMVMQVDIDSTKSGRGREVRLSNLPIDYRFSCFECQFEKITLRPIDSVLEGGSSAPKAGLSFFPYVLMSREYGVGQAKMGFDLERKNETTAIWLTVNPDYSSVESDPYVSDINQKNVISRSENRHFFQSVAPLLFTPLDLLYTRSIIDPDIGAQYKRESDGSSMAFMASNDSTLTYTVYDRDTSYESTVLEESLNFVGRFSRILESGSTWSIFGSSRFADGYLNSTLSLDGNYFPNKNSKLTGQVAFSRTRSDEHIYAGTQSSDGEAIFLGHNYANSKYVAYTAVRYVSDDFQAGLGQVGRPGVNFSHSSKITNKNTLLNIFTESGFRFNLNLDASNDFFVRSYGESYSAYVLAGKYRASISFDRNLNREIFENDTYSHVATFGLSRKSGVCLNFVNAASGRSPDYRNETLGDIKRINYGISCSGSTVPWYVTVNLAHSNFKSDFELAGYETNVISIVLDRSWQGRHKLEGGFDIVDSSNKLNPFSPSTYNGVVGSVRYIYAPERKGQLIFGANFDKSRFNVFESNHDVLYIKYRTEY